MCDVGIPYHITRPQLVTASTSLAAELAYRSQLMIYCLWEQWNFFENSFPLLIFVFAHLLLSFYFISFLFLPHKPSISPINPPLAILVYSHNHFPFLLNGLPSSFLSSFSSLSLKSFFKPQLPANLQIDELLMNDMHKFDTKTRQVFFSPAGGWQCCHLKDHSGLSVRVWVSRSVLEQLLAQMYQCIHA